MSADNIENLPLTYSGTFIRPRLRFGFRRAVGQSWMARIGALPPGCSSAKGADSDQAAFVPAMGWL